MEWPHNGNSVVGEGGLEPPRPFEHWHLKPARLPFRHSPEWMLHASDWGSTPQPIRDICSGIIIVMSTTDWESRELHDASRERLLTEIGVLKDSLQRVHSTSRIGELESELALTKEQVLSTQLELLAARDFAMGAAAHAGEQQAQFLAQSAQLAAAQDRVELKRELLAARDFAMGAAAHAGEQQAQLLAQGAQLAAAQDRIVFLSKHINRMRNSTTWKLGRIVMLPARIAKRILRRSS